MNKPLEQFICDKCGEPVTVADGYTYWGTVVRDGRYHDYGFTIRHQTTCAPRKSDNLDTGMPLNTMVGNAGLTRLTAHLSYGPMKVDAEDTSTPPLPVNMNEFIDFFRRLQLPYYDEARQYFDHTDVIATYHDANEVSVYLAEWLQDIIKIGSKVNQDE